MIIHKLCVMVRNDVLIHFVIVWVRYQLLRFKFFFIVIEETCCFFELFLSRRACHWYNLILHHMCDIHCVYLCNISCSYMMVFFFFFFLCINNFYLGQSFIILFFFLLDGQDWFQNGYDMGIGEDSMKVVIDKSM